MSVELDGPAGYDRQYEVTVLFFLAHIEVLHSLNVEPAGGEDSTAVLNTPVGTRTVEIQAKSGAEVDLPMIAKCLQHFPPRHAEGTLLSRLKTDEHRLFVLFSTGRCVDRARFFATRIENAAAPSNTARIGKTDAGALIDAIESAGARGANPTDLKKMRTDYIKMTIPSVEDVVSLSKRMFVVEQVDERRTEEDAARLLVRRGVPSSMARDVFRRMVDHVRKVRIERGDALPGLISVLEGSQGPRAFQEAFHVARPVERELIELARDRHVVLLTGHAHCGKSHTARLVAQEFQDGGFEYNCSSCLDRARDFLLAPTQADRVFLFEDPFDGQNASGMLRGLTRIIRELRDNRVLLVTSRADEIPGGATEETVDGHRWFDLTLRDACIAAQIWERLATDTQVEEKERKLVGEYISAMDHQHLLQPGQLRHLARNFSPGASIDVLIRSARFNSSEIASEAQSLGTEATALLSTLAFISDPLGLVPTNELAFVLSDSDESPGITFKTGRVTSLFGKPVEYKFPGYKQSYALSPGVLDMLELFARRGWLRYQADTISFAHPDYHEAAWKVAASISLSHRRAVLNAVKRSVDSLDARASLRAIRSLERAEGIWRADEDREAVCSIAVHALKSIFPASRDAGLLYLLTRIDSLSQDDFSRVENRVTTDDVSGEDVAWENGTPYLPEEVSGRSFLREAFTDVTTGGLATAEDVWRALHQKPSLDVLRRGLLADEVFIRCKSARIFCSTALSTNSYDVLDQILEDHPRVVAAGLKGLFEGWPALGNELQAIAVKRFNSCLSIPKNAWAAAPFLWRIYHYVGEKPKEAKARWALWGELYPTVLKIAPNRKYRPDQVVYSAIEARAHMSQAARIALADAWLAWLVRQLKRTLPAGDALAVGHYMVEAISPGAAEREAAIATTLQHVDTGFVAVCLRDYIHEWDRLTSTERELIRAVLAGNRVDKIWLHAVALTTDRVPQELVGIMIGRTDALGLEPAELVSLLEPGLLAYCVRVHLGHPQPLWWLSLQFDDEQGTWHAVCRYLRSDPTCSLFGELWELALMGDPHKDGLLEEWKTVCRSVDTEQLDTMFHALFRSTSDSNWDFKDHWDALWNHAPDTLRNRWISHIANCVERFFRYSKPSDMPKAAIDSLLAILPSDELAIKAVILIDTKEDHHLAIEMLDALYSLPATQPRLAFVHDIVLDAVRGSVADEVLRERLVSAIAAALKRSYTREESDDESVDDSIASDDWVYSHETSCPAMQGDNG